VAAVADLRSLPVTAEPIGDAIGVYILDSDMRGQPPDLHRINALLVWRAICFNPLCCRIGHKNRRLARLNGLGEK
jgi:hypothetical protein